jgi:hypothetical protein
VEIERLNALVVKAKPQHDRGSVPRNRFLERLAVHERRGWKLLPAMG